MEIPFVIKSEISSEMDLGTGSGCVPELPGRLKPSNGAVASGTSIGSGARSTSSCAAVALVVSAVALDATAVAFDASVAGRGAAAGPPAPSPRLLDLLGSHGLLQYYLSECRLDPLALRETVGRC